MLKIRNIDFTIYNCIMKMFNIHFRIRNAEKDSDGTFYLFIFINKSSLIKYIYIN